MAKTRPDSLWSDLNTLPYDLEIGDSDWLVANHSGAVIGRRKERVLETSDSDWLMTNNSRTLIGYDQNERLN